MLNFVFSSSTFSISLLFFFCLKLFDGIQCPKALHSRERGDPFQLIVPNDYQFKKNKTLINLCMEFIHLSVAFINLSGDVRAIYHLNYDLHSISNTWDGFIHS